MIKEFYYVDSNRNQIGPIPFSDRKVVGLTPSTLVWHEGLTEWIKAGSVQEFKDIFAPVPPPIPAVDDSTRISPGSESRKTSNQGNSYGTNRYEAYENDTYSRSGKSALWAKMNKPQQTFPGNESSTGRSASNPHANIWIMIGAGLVIALVLTLLSMNFIPYTASLFSTHVYTAAWLYTGFILLIFLILAGVIRNRNRILALVLAGTGILSFGASDIVMGRSNLWNLKYTDGTAVKSGFLDDSGEIYDKWGDEIYSMSGTMVKIMRVKNVDDHPDARFLVVKMSSDKGRYSSEGGTIKCRIELLDKDADLIDSENNSFYSDGSKSTGEIFNLLVKELTESGNFQVVN